MYRARVYGVEMLLDAMVRLLSRLVCFVFFFKQKTAYEMRISDWSSDVCSSDLFPGEEEPVSSPDDYRALLDHSVDIVIDGGPCGTVPTTEIGRASCRERVCQYV